MICTIGHVTISSETFEAFTTDPAAGDEKPRRAGLMDLFEARVLLLREFMRREPKLTESLALVNAAIERLTGDTIRETA